MGVINTGLTPSFLLPGATKAFGTAYSQKPTTYDRLFEMKASDSAFEEMALMSGMQQAKAKTEGAAIEYDSMKQLYVNRATHVTYALGYIVTQEAIDDVKAEEIAVMRAKQLKRAHVWKKELVANSVLNDAFSSSRTYGDGKKLISNDHPTMDGVQSNVIAVDSDLSEAALESLLVQIYSAVDVDGGVINLSPSKLIIPPALEPTAFRILESMLRSGTADNDANYLKGRIPEVVVDNFLTDADAWFVKTDVADGLIMYNRKPLTFEQDMDFDTSNVRFKASERYSVTVGDWRTVYGSQGA